jgi:hypothetical protein
MVGDPASTTPPESPTPSRPDLPFRHLAVSLALILLVGFGVRVYLLAAMPIVARDGVTFIRYARQLRITPIREIRRQRQHPGFPIALAVVHEACERAGLLPDDDVRRWIIAGQIVAVSAAGVAILGAYALAAALFDRRVGIVAAACMALLPDFARYSVDVLSDSLHLALFILAMAAAVTAVQRRSLARFALAGALSAAAFWVRPEGAEVALVASLASLVWPARPWKRRLAGAAACALAFAVLVAPYVFLTGHITGKKPLEQFVNPAAPDPAPCTMLASVPAHDVLADVPWVLRGLGRIVENWGRSLRVMYALPAILWLALRRRRMPPRPGWPLLVAAFVLHSILCLRLLRAFDYWDLFSVRHVLVLAAMTLPFTAAGLWQISEFLSHAARWSIPRAAFAVALVVVAPTTPWLLRTPNRDDAYLRDAGQWVREHYPLPQIILTDRWRVPYYADGVFFERWQDGQCVRWPGTADAQELAGWVLRWKPDLVALDEPRLLRQNPAFFLDLERLAIEPGLLRYVHTATQRSNHVRRAVRIYEVPR